MRGLLVPSALAALMLGLSPALASAEEKPLTILFTGDNGGEVGPCGCKHVPTGGLARRKSLVESTRKNGPALVVDSGNALFQHTGVPVDGSTQHRARFILKAMGQMGTVAMAVGPRDLIAGPGWLKKEAEKAGVPLLSTNLVDAKGTLLFAPSKVVEIEGKKVALIGVSPEGPVGKDAGVKGNPGASAVRAEARKLRSKADIVVVLAALPYAESLQLAQQLGGSVDFILQSHESRGTGSAQKVEGSFLMPSGDRGRQVGRLVLDLSGKGAFVDSGELKRDLKTLEILDGQIVEVKRRIAAAKDADTKAPLEKTLKAFEARKNQIASRASTGDKGPAGRTMNLDFVALDPSFGKGDPTLAAEAQRIDPTGGH
ncbi:MAG: 5'-nucleotidase [Myxococcaceae bacterium]